MAVRARNKTFTSLLAVLFLLLTAGQADAGPLRERERFNVHGDGFWMKGRCFTPGSITIPDEYNLVIFSRLDDFGCLVKNRRGKRRARKRKARVVIDLSWVVETDTSGLRVIELPSKTCEHSRRCRSSVEEPLPSGTPWPRPWRVVGLIAEICGQRRETHKFKEPRLVPGGPRIDWCLNWGTDCGEEAADAFCRRQGYARAVEGGFKKDPGVSTVTLVQGSGRTCDGRDRHCDSFKRIKCMRHRDATSFTVHVGRTPADGSGVLSKRTGLRRCR